MAGSSEPRISERGQPSAVCRRSECRESHFTVRQSLIQGEAEGSHSVCQGTSYRKLEEIFVSMLTKFRVLVCY
jgi:hypothetical protein